MASALLKRQVATLAAELAALRPKEPPALARLRADPARILSDAGMPGDPWQQQLLRAAAARTLLLCSRQAGKSTVAAALALREALLRPGSLVLILSPTLRQASECFRAKVMPLFNGIGRPVAAVQESTLQLTLANESRVIALPGNEGGIRGYSSV